MPPASASCHRNGSGNFFSRKLVVQRGFLLFQRRAMAGLSLFLLLMSGDCSYLRENVFGPLPDLDHSRHPSCATQRPMGMDE